jgi:DNA-binding beta-propeller fold protein YncE
VEAVAVSAADTKGLLAVDKMGGKVIFLDPASYATTNVLDDFERTPHELLIIRQTATAYIPIFGNGVHGRNPKPGHLLSVVDLKTRTHEGDVDLSPLVAPHGLQLAPDGFIYLTCENSGVVAIVDHLRREVVGTIEAGSTNAHRLALAPDGRTLYTENEEDASISVIDLPARKLLRQVSTPHPLAGIAISPDGRFVVAVSDNEPVLFCIDAASHELVRTVALNGAQVPAQIARFSPDGRVLLITSVRGGTATLIDMPFGRQVTLPVGKQPMDATFHNGRLFVACQGDGSVHIIDVAERRWLRSFTAGVGCETLGFF